MVYAQKFQEHLKRMCSTINGAFSTSLIGDLLRTNTKEKSYNFLSTTAHLIEENSEKSQLFFSIYRNKIVNVWIFTL